MIGLLFLLFISVYLSMIFEKKIVEILPPLMLTLLVGLYYIAIAGYSHHSFFLSCIASIAVFLLFAVKYKRIIPTFEQLKDKLSLRHNTGLYIYIVICIIMAYCYHNHFVLVWDDFHYNANFPKDMWFFGKMPVGFRSTTIYKDYFPTLQLFYYWGFQSVRHFSEPLMFTYKVILAYTCMLPFFSEADSGSIVKRCVSVVFAIILPYMTLIEILDSLSMDACLALIFAYAAISVMSDSERDWFFYYRIIISLNALVLFKSYALIFAAVVLFMWFVRIFLNVIIKKQKSSDIQESRNSYKIPALILALGAFTTFASFFSWKLFCKKYGNMTYLTGILKENVGSGGFNPPDYAADTIKNILKSLATMHLNFGRLGFTVLSAVIFCIAITALLIYVKAHEWQDIVSHVILLLGYCGFILFLMYTYVFIFEEWEARDLSSLDRYLGSYLLTIMYVILYKFVCTNKSARLVNASLVIAALMCVFSLNFSRIADALIPSRYLQARADEYNVMNEVKSEVEKLAASLDESRGRVLVACNEENTLYSRYMDYYFIPTVTIPYNSAVIEDSELADVLRDKYYDNSGSYVYFTKRLSSDEHFHEFEALMDENTELKTGVIYTFNENGMLVEN